VAVEAFEAPPGSQRTASVPAAARDAVDTAASSESMTQLAPPPSVPAPRADTVGASPTDPAEVASVRANLPASAPAESRLEQEVHLLRDADRAVKAGDPERALVLLDRHATAFPHSTLEPERMAERVFALCRAGRIAQARAEAATFLTAHPEGPLALRVRSSCSEAGR
jgi:hypothetical protein